MTYRAYIEHDYARHGVSIHIANRQHRDGAVISYVLQPAVLEWVPAEENAHSQPGLNLPENVARALLDALSAHFGGTSDTRQLRSDFEHERGRVDRLITHLTKDNPRA